MIWHKIKGTLTLQFILLPEFSLFSWDRAVSCFVWDNSRASGGFWGLQLFTACRSNASINMVLLWRTFLCEGRSQTKPFLGFTMSFHKSQSAAAGTLGSVLPHGNQHWEVTAVPSPTEDHGCKMVTSLLVTAFPTFFLVFLSSFRKHRCGWLLAPQRRWHLQSSSGDRQLGRVFCLQELHIRSLPSPVPCAGVSHLLVLTKGRSVVWPCSWWCAKACYRYGNDFCFSQDFFFFQILTSRVFLLGSVWLCC